MNPTTAGTKLAIALDTVLAGTSSTTHSVTGAISTFWSAFNAELQRRRSERAALRQAVPEAKPF